MMTSSLDLFNIWTSVCRVNMHGHSWMLRHALTMILLLMSVFPKMAFGSSCGDAVLPPVENPKDGACGDMDIRNSVKNFKMLENCTVIEGSLHISLIDYVPQEEYNKYSFPMLREITGHLMMFRVFGLRTLRNLFPNLAVIRGQSKFFKEYVLVAYEMRDLEELGLVGLTTINGSVRLTRNHKLCHISSIDWGRLAQGVDPSKHLFIDNREEQLCPDFCNESCPSTTYQGIARKRCWTSKPDDCQRNLVCQCPKGVSCAPNGSCCNEYCMGGCRGLTASDCYVCSNVVYKNTCQPHCPPQTYMLSNRRCLIDKECINLRTRSARVNRSDSSDNFPKLLEGDSSTPSQCVFKCPPGYMVNDSMSQNNPQCIRCQGFCPKVCNTTKVISIKDSEKLFGCSKIDGNLEIQITGGKDIDYELTKNLGDIREVTGYIRIWKSYALLTLHFFRDLEIIGGEKLVHKGYSLFIADNTNLQEIFPDQQMKKMIIRKGGIGFHGNRKLCFSKISSFAKQMNITSGLDEKRIDISNTSNGNLIPCNKNITLNLTLSFMHPLLNLSWEAYLEGDSRQLIKYIINYKEITESVRDIYQGRDACSDNEWKTEDIKPFYDAPKLLYEPQFENILLAKLKPFTKYAIYVQASTLSSASVSAMSRVLYFQTSPYSPTDPTDLEVSSSDPHELTVKWNPPKFPNGNVTHYKIFYQPQVSSTNGFEQRDYCKEPSVHTKDVQKEKEKKNIEEIIKAETDHTPRCCSCPISAEEQLKQERIRELEIAFQNDLHDIIYSKIRRKECNLGLGEVNIDDSKVTELVYKGTRRRRNADVSKIGMDFSNPIIFHYRPREMALSQNLTDLDGNSSTTDLNLKQEVIVYDTTVTLSNLEHFHSYNIEVVACHETDSVTGIKLCGESAIITGQTAANPLFDNLNSSLVIVEPVVNKSGEVLIRWEPPLLPNGLILKYYLKYRKVDVDRSSIPVTVCVSAKQFHNNSNGYLLQGLSTGNYSVQISAHSLAGNGTYTEDVFFYIITQHGAGDDDRLKLIIGVSVGVIAFIVLIVVAVCCYQRYRFVKPDVIVSQNPHYIPTDQLYAPDEWEVPRDTIRLIKELGQGSFGTVFEGLMEDQETKVITPVAVKTVNDKADFHERLKILKEATTMKAFFESHHVVQLLGVVSKGQPALVIMELMALGDLRNYLRKCRLEEENYPNLYPPTNDQVRQMAGEIADGMAYLSDKKIIHRDLAARNCLVSEDGTVKIADFGMARDVYMTEYYRKDQRALLPVRWMAPESLKDGIYTTMSDIWSYGIVLWEVVTLAEQPYQGLGNDEVLHFVTEGRTMSPPLGCPSDLYSMMQRCWAYNPKHRPTFKSLIELLLPYLNDRFHEVSYFFREVVRSDAEDEREKANERNLGQAEMNNAADEKTEADQDYNEEDNIMTGVNSISDEDDDKEKEGMEDGSPLAVHASQSFGSLSHVGNSLSNKKEHFPLIPHQHNVQEPFLCLSSVSAGSITDPGDFYTDEDDDVDSDNDFIRKNDKYYIRPSKDAKSSSERLKLLSDSPGSSRPKLEMLPELSFSVKGGGSGRVDYEFMSPSTDVSSKLNDEKNPLSSSPSVSSYLPMSTTTVSNPPQFSLAHTLPPEISPSPVLHVDMEGIGSSRGTNQKKSTAIDMTGHDGVDHNWLFQNNNPTNKSGAREGQMKFSESSSNSNSNSNSIKSGSEGSKESSSSSGSHHRLNSGTANGHGPFNHQQAALC